MAGYKNSQNIMFSHFLCRNYFFEKSYEFFKASDEEKIKVLNELWITRIDDFPENDYHIDVNQKPNWNIMYHVFDDKDNVPIFNDSEIMIIELPTPKLTRESHYICLGVGSPPKIYDTIIPFYILLEYFEEDNTYLGGYFIDEKYYHYFIPKPVEPDIQSFLKSIAERLNLARMEITIPAEINDKGEEITFNVFQLVDHLWEIDDIGVEIFENENYKQKK